MSNLRISYKFDGKTMQDLRDGLIKLIEDRRNMVPSGQNTRLAKAEADGQLRAYNHILDILHNMEFDA